MKVSLTILEDHSYQTDFRYYRTIDFMLKNGRFKNNCFLSSSDFDCWKFYVSISSGETLIFKTFEEFPCSFGYEQADSALQWIGKNKDRICNFVKKTRSDRINS